MAKSQKKSNREIRKPKAVKSKPNATLASTSPVSEVVKKQKGKH